jgi:hypothetical protein
MRVRLPRITHPMLRKMSIGGGVLAPKNKRPIGGRDGNTPFADSSVAIVEFQGSYYVMTSAEGVFAPAYTVLGSAVSDMVASWVGAPSTKQALLIHGDTDLLDYSPVGRTVNTFGSIAPTTTSPVIGVGSINFNGTNQYLTCADSADFAFAARQWSVDFRLTLLATPLTDQPLVCQWSNPSNMSWYIGTNNSFQLRFGRSLNGTSNTFTGTTTVFALNTPVHVAVWRWGATAYMAVNGAIVFTFSLSGLTFFDSTAPLGIGALGDGSSITKAMRMDELRICVDDIDYTNVDFTPRSTAYT